MSRKHNGRTSKRKGKSLKNKTLEKSTFRLSTMRPERQRRKQVWNASTVDLHHNYVDNLRRSGRNREREEELTTEDDLQDGPTRQENKNSTKAPEPPEKCNLERIERRQKRSVPDSDFLKPRFEISERGLITRARLETGAYEAVRIQLEGI